MKDNKDQKQYYLTVKNTMTGKYEKVFVTEEVYRTYKRFDRAEKKRKQRLWRCKIPREGFSERQKSFLKRCNQNCSECPYGEQLKDSVVSLDALREEHAEVEDYSFDPATVSTEETRSDYEKSALHDAIKSLLPRQQQLIKLMYFDGLSHEQIAEREGVSRRAISYALERAEEALRKILQNF